MSPVAVIQDETSMNSESHQGSSSQDFAALGDVPSLDVGSMDSLLDSSEPVSDCETNSASMILKCLNSTTPPAPLVVRASDKSAIIRLNNELLKSKRSNWQVVDALSKAYQELKALRLREQRFNLALTEENASVEKTLRSYTDEKMLSFQFALMKEDFLNARKNVQSLMNERDALKESLSRAQSELRLLSFENSRKVSELELTRDRVKSVEVEVRHKNDRIIQAEQNVSLLEREMSERDRKLEEITSKQNVLNEAVTEKDREIEELKRRLGAQAVETKKSEDQVSQNMENSLQRIHSLEQELREVKENESRLVEERRKLQESVQALKGKRTEDNKIIFDLTAQVREWERYVARYDVYILNSAG